MRSNERVDRNELLRRLDAFVARTYSKPIYASDIARAIGVATRTLHDLTVKAHGMSPQLYIRLFRLKMVHVTLSSASDAATVKSTALYCGFRHLGDFARYYRDQFGELPSETVQAARHLADAGVTATRSHTSNSNEHHSSAGRAVGGGATK